jgi:hypothetical protein
MPIPAIIGGAVALGTLAGNMYSASQDRKSRREGRKELKKLRNQTVNDYDSILGDIDSYYTNRGSLGTKKDADDYKTAMGSYNPSDFTLSPDKLKYTGFGKSVQDYMNPYYDKIIGDTAATVQHTAAGAGLGRGSGAATAIADAVAKKNDELYKTALQEYNSERDFDYRTWDDYTRNMMDQLAQKRQATETKIAMQGDLAKDYYNVMDAAQADRMKAQQDRMAAQQQYDIAMTGLY